MAEFDEKELSGVILEGLRKQVLPLIEKKLNRVAVATERLSVLASRAENFAAQKVKLEKELADLKAKLADVDACEDPGDINRQICAKETERAGLGERIESLSKGGDAFSISRKELENAKTDLQQHIHQAILSNRAEYEEEYNVLLEKAWNFHQAWKSAIDSLYSENDSYGGPYTYSLFADRKRSDLIIRGQY